MDALKQKLIESSEKMFQSFLLKQSLKKDPVAHKKNYEHQRWLKTKDRLDSDPVFAAEYRAMQKAAQAKHLAKKPRPPRRIELQDQPEKYAKYLADRRRRYAERCASDPNYRADCAKKNREAKGRFTGFTGDLITKAVAIQPFYFLRLHSPVLALCR